jgi:GAF domain-containing protein
MGLALGLGLSLRYIHRYVDRFVDRVLFRRRHEDEAALRRFAHESSYITDRSILLERAVREVKEHTNAAEATILVQDGAAAYSSAKSDGARTIASENDPGILALRAWQRPVDLGSLEDSVLRGEFALPMVSRGALVGVLVCGAKRNGEVYAPDELEALLAVARGVGTSLDVLSAQRDQPNELVLRELAELREDLKRMSRI